MNGGTRLWPVLLLLLLGGWAQTAPVADKQNTTAVAASEHECWCNSLDDDCLPNFDAPVPAIGTCRDGRRGCVYEFEHRDGAQLTCARQNLGSVTEYSVLNGHVYSLHHVCHKHLCMPKFALSVLDCPWIMAPADTAGQLRLKCKCNQGKHCLDGECTFAHEKIPRDMKAACRYWMVAEWSTPIIDCWYSAQAYDRQVFIDERTTYIMCRDANYCNDKAAVLETLEGDNHCPLFAVSHFHEQLSGMSSQPSAGAAPPQVDENGDAIEYVEMPAAESMSAEQNKVHNIDVVATSGNGQQQAAAADNDTLPLASDSGTADNATLIESAGDSSIDQNMLGKNLIDEFQEQPDGSPTEPQQQSQQGQQQQQQQQQQPTKFSLTAAPSEIGTAIEAESDRRDFADYDDYSMTPSPSHASDSMAPGSAGDSMTPGRDDDSITPNRGGDSMTPDHAGDSMTPSRGGNSLTPGRSRDPMMKPKQRQPDTEYANSYDEYDADDGATPRTLSPDDRDGPAGPVPSVIIRAEEQEPGIQHWSTKLTAVTLSFAALVIIFIIAVLVYACSLIC